MFGAKELKPKIAITETEVECPVKRCPEKVARQRKSFRRATKFRCPRHGIHISPSTFEYDSEEDNILWKSPSDTALLKLLKQAKRESRIARDNSEDALSWNVFRFLERSKALLPWVESITGRREGGIEDVVYWSHSSAEKGQWSLLNQARLEFGEEIERGSEPDIAIVTSETIVFVEAKLTSTSKTSGGKKTLARRLGNPKSYTTGGDLWFGKVFSSDYETLLNDQKYELMRFWLLGTWMAAQQNRDFFLVCLVCQENEPEVQEEFLRHINTTSRRRFLRLTWEEIAEFSLARCELSDDRERFIRYMANKTIGYDHKGQLQMAFKL